LNKEQSVQVCDASKAE